MTKVQSATKVPKIVVSLRSIVCKKGSRPFGRTLISPVVVAFEALSSKRQILLALTPDDGIFDWHRGPDFLCLDKLILFVTYNIAGY